MNAPLALIPKPAALLRQRVATVRKLLPGWRSLQGCGRRMIDPTSSVRVIASYPSGGPTGAGSANVRFAGLRRCRSVWTCPSCARAITERRSAEMVGGVKCWCEAGNAVALTTLTLPHSRHDGLPDLLARLRVAVADLKKSRTYQQARADLGIVGSVRAFEVTVGEVNGWHPHFHQLEFIKGKVHEAALAVYHDAILPVWQSCCEGAGLGRPSDERGVDIVMGETVHERIAAYTAKWGCEPQKKWGAEKELCKAAVKTAKYSERGGERFHPFALLDAVAETGEKIYANWWLEYATNFKGQRQLVWSRGLKAQLRALGMVEEKRTDQQIAESAELEPGEFIVADIIPSDWCALAKARLFDPLSRALERCPRAFVVASFIRAAWEGLSARYGPERIARLADHLVDKGTGVILLRSAMQKTASEREASAALVAEGV